MNAASLRNKALSLVAVLAVWWLATAGLGLFTPLILPSPLDVASAAVSLATDGGLFSGGLYEANLFGHVLISLERVCLAWSAAVAVALPMGLLVGAVPRFERYIGLSVQVFSQVPPIAYIPLAVLWFGLGELPILFIIFIGAVWTMFINVVAGVRKVPVVLLRAARSQGASELQIFGVAWAAIVAAELVASSSGLGYLIMHARRILASGDIIVGMACIAVLGLMFDTLFRAIERRVCRWK
jgi:ABC-type nitrate/sulfonate/bicarbonate transport system permease component